MKKVLEKFGLKTQFSLMLASLALIPLLTGCLDDSSSPQAEVAFVSLYHASPDASDLDIMMENGYAINVNPFEYGDYTGYSSFYTGNRRFRFTETGSSSAILIDTTFHLSLYRYYSIFVADSLDNIEALIFGDSATTPGTGKAMLRAINLSPDAPAVDVYADDDEWFTDLSFKDGTAFTEVDAGTVDITFRAYEDNSQVLLSSPSVEVKEGEYYTLILNGFVNPSSVDAKEISSDLIKN